MTSAIFMSVLLLAAAVVQTAAIGPCNNTLVTAIMAANAKNCPKDILKQIYGEGPQLTFRVMSKPFASLFSCVTSVMEKPEDNISVFHLKFSFYNESLSPFYVNFTSLEGRCGIMFKYIAEDSFVGFKIAHSYNDGISYGYYGCTNEATPFSSEDGVYAMCFGPAIDSEEVEASFLKCKTHMEKVTGATDLVLTPACDNENEYLPGVLAKYNTTTEVDEGSVLPTSCNTTVS